LHAKCRSLIEKSWEVNSHQVDPWHLISSKLEECKTSLMGWQCEERQRLKWAIEEKFKKLAVLQGAENSLATSQALELQKELQISLEQEDLKWRQRAKMDWFKFGDRNSKFFHACANQRRKANNIDHIHDEGGFYGRPRGGWRGF
jgi:hypothetical protein